MTILRPGTISARIIILVILPPAVVAAFLDRLVREIRSAFRFAFLDAAFEVATAAQLWRKPRRRRV